ncbi:glucose-1-phosphate cytidylyltransferase [Novosphingobium sp.]|uniref:glucose-1-phosphate cytidylyltransferase n=1 Tax=Novosphingobium sp. TaxID=1874826 RepID=UPI003D14788F
MKAIILAGGLGTRLAEETALRPKPMVEIGGKPILWHIMKSYAAHGVKDFIICLGYKGYMIKEYFFNYAIHMSDLTVDLRSGETQIHRNSSEDWRISLIDTGDLTMTGGRLRQAMAYLDPAEDDFCLTYGDGVSDCDIGALIGFHKAHGRKATVTAVRPASRYGQLALDGTTVKAFAEKPVDEGGWINGGFFVLNRSIASALGTSNECVWEREPLEQLAAQGELQSFFHNGFWQPMDTLRDRQMLEAMWDRKEAPWKVWA